MAKCGHKDCELPATHGLEIRIWAKGHPKRADNFMKMFMPLDLCLGHALEVEPAKFFIDESWNRIAAALIGVGRAEPDRTTAEIHPSPLLNVKGMLRDAARRSDTVVFDKPEKQN